MWSLTPREFESLKEVWKSSRDHASQLVAAIQATLHNAHFRSENDAVYLPSDFTGDTDWSARQKKVRMDRLRGKADLARINTRLARLRPGVLPDDLPEWAKAN